MHLGIDSYNLYTVLQYIIININKFIIYKFNIYYKYQYIFCIVSMYHLIVFTFLHMLFHNQNNTLRHVMQELFSIFQTKTLK